MLALTRWKCLKSISLLARFLEVQLPNWRSTIFPKQRTRFVLALPNLLKFNLALSIACLYSIGKKKHSNWMKSNRCFAQKCDAGLHAVGHVLTLHRRPPPCRMQNLDGATAAVKQRGCAQLMPPPCLVQNKVPRSHLFDCFVHPMTKQVLLSEAIV